MRGRYPSGPEFVDKLDGSPEAKERLKVLLETIAGQLRVGDACAAWESKNPASTNCASNSCKERCRQQNAGVQGAFRMPIPLMRTK